MAERKAPHEKKALSYTRDHVIRTGKPTRPSQHAAPDKEQTNRTFRRKVHQTLDVEQSELVLDPLEDTSVDAIRRERIEKPPATPLGEWIGDRLDMRVEHTASNYFKRPYSSAEHRDKFAAFLDSLVRGHSENSRKLAKYFSAVLDPNTHGTASTREWLLAFFRDEPAREVALREWIAAMTAWDASEPPRLSPPRPAAR